MAGTPIFAALRSSLQRLTIQEALNILCPDDFDIFSGRSGILNYDGGTGAFTVGQTVTGGDSGHTGTIVAIVGNTASGYLRLNDCSGAFQDDEAITDAATGAAVANGTLSPHTGYWSGFTVAANAKFAALTTGEGAKIFNVTTAFAAPFSCVADVRAIQLSEGAIMAHKINT